MNLETLAVLANLCQLASFDMNLTEVSNDSIMKHLLQQDKILDEQTNNYLSKIVKQNEEIISLLKDIQERIDNLNLK
jgi:hypothetical protein